MKFQKQIYLNGRTLIGERTAEKSRDDTHQAVGYVVFKNSIGVFTIVSCGGYQAHVHDEGFFKQGPHVVRGVDFFHLNFRVDVAVIQKIYIRLFYL